VKRKKKRINREIFTQTDSPKVRFATENKANKKNWPIGTSCGSERREPVRGKTLFIAVGLNNV